MKLVIIDYGVGNLYSLTQACKYLGYDAVVSRDHDMIMEADKVILPGVGAFGQAMDVLRDLGVYQVLQYRIQNKKPILGICLGMQLLFEVSEEFGKHDGINVFAGQVKKLSENGHRVPNVGWYSLQKNSLNWNETILDGISSQDAFYFTHSYCALNVNDRENLASTSWGQDQFCAVVSNGVISGCQFHPEKSGPAGLKILENFFKI